MARSKAIHTINEFINLVNESSIGIYEAGQGVDDENEPLELYVSFDSAKWAYYPEANTKSLVLFSEAAGKDRGRISISEVQGVEQIRSGEKGVAVAVTAGNREPKRYVFYINK